MKTIKKILILENNAYTLKYWLNKGLSEEEAINKFNEIHEKAVNSKKVNKQKHPEDYIGTSNTQIEYWLKKGLTEEEARIALVDRKNTNSLEKFIKRCGEEEGTKLWEQRQINWQKTLNSKSQEEIDRINKSKGSSLNSLIEKYGITEANELYKVYCKHKKDGHTLEGFIKIYGEIDGIKRWNSFKLSISFANSLQGYITKYGYEEGLKLYKDRYELSTISLKNLIRIYGEIEGRSRYTQIIINCAKRTSKKWYIQKYGEKIGLEKWNFSHNNQRKYSKISIQFFEKIIKKLTNKKLTILFKENEYCLYGNNRMNFYDFTILEYKLIIEFNGSHVHPDTRMNEKEWNEWRRAWGKNHANEVYENDCKKIKLVENMGYKVFVFFDKDIKNNEKKCINEVLNYIWENYNE